MAIKLNSNFDSDILLDESILTELANSYYLILWNDDFNTFDHVIVCLITICEHEQLQAQQCALIVHNKGKCKIKSGPLEKMKFYKTALVEQGLSVTIEKN